MSTFQKVLGFVTWVIVCMVAILFVMDVVFLFVHGLASFEGDIVWFREWFWKMLAFLFLMVLGVNAGMLINEIEEEQEDEDGSDT